MLHQTVKVSKACPKYQKQLVFVLLYLTCSVQHRLGVKWSWQCTARTAELLNGFRYQAAELSPCALPSTLAGLTWLWLSWTGLRPVISQAQSTCTHLYCGCCCCLEKHSQMSWISDGSKSVTWWLGLRLLFWHLIISVWSFLLMLCIIIEVSSRFCYAGTLPKY